MTRDDVPVDPLTPTHAETASDTAPQAASHAGSASRLPYRLGEVIGRGGMGEVVVAHDAHMGREVALKRMRAASPSAELVERFLREARIQARLDHPAIVPVHELGADADGLPYFTMKRLTGTTLAALLESGTATQQRLLRALVGVCQAVELAHARFVVHRDLKPANIMLGDYGEVYVLDWGVARVLADPRRSAPVIDVISFDGDTKTGALLGTPGYMAPEQARGAEVGTPADVYALGSILFEILAGEPLHPRGADALASTLGSVDLSPARRSPSRVIAPELDAVCNAALATDPRSRPTAGELAVRIQSYLDGDRDVEQRRRLARDELQRASDALASDDPAGRAAAVHAAGRALAFDPSSTEAAELVAQLLIEPPKQLPPELTTAVASDEEQALRARSRRALIPWLSFFVVLTPVVPLLTVRSWPLLIGLYVTVALLAAMSWVNWKVRRVPLWFHLGAALMFVVLFSRLNGPFIHTPMLIATFLLALTPIPWLNERKGFVMAWTAVAVLAPFVLERLGAFARTWEMTDHGLVSAGSVFDPTTTNGLPSALFNLAFAMLVASYAVDLARDSRSAQRRLMVQAWHLKQLLPREGLGVR